MSLKLKSGVVFPREGNPHWPLPKDYASLSLEGQKMARTNACRMFDSWEHATSSWAWFKDFYLSPDLEAGFDPGFYRPPYLASPPLHYSLVKSWFLHDFMALCWPRECAKTSVKQSMIMWLLCSVPRYQIASFLAKEDFLIREANLLKTQLETNDRILEDFGNLRPTKGAGIWNNHALLLTSGAGFSGFSIDGRKRGARPNWAVLDDVENDHSADRTDDERQKLKEDVLKVVLPMLGSGCKLTLLGTLISKRNFLFSVIQNEDLDARFLDVSEGGDWYKQHVAAIDSLGQNVWRAKYTPEFLAQRRRMMGESHFQTEYLNDPKSEATCLFRIEPDRHEYALSEQDSAALTQPWSSNSSVSFKEIQETQVVERVAKWPDHLNSLYRMITVDYAYSLSPGADYSVVMVTGQNALRDLWVLDAWQGRVTSAGLAAKVWELAFKWKVMVVGVEAVPVQNEIVNMIRERGEPFRDKYGWLPAYRPIKYPANYPKESRIAGLEWRFNRGKIKLPGFRRTESTFYELYRQLTGFTGDPKSLSHDDLIDALAMTQFTASGGAPLGDEKAAPSTPESLLMQGYTTYPGTTVPLHNAVDIHGLSAGACDAILYTARWHRDQDSIDPRFGPDEFVEEPAVDVPDFSHLENPLWNRDLLQ